MELRHGQRWASCPSVALWLGHLARSLSPPSLHLLRWETITTCAWHSQWLPVGSVPEVFASSQGGAKGAGGTGGAPFDSTVPVYWDLHMSQQCVPGLGGGGVGGLVLGRILGPGDLRCLGMLMGRPACVWDGMGLGYRGTPGVGRV